MLGLPREARRFDDLTGQQPSVARLYTEQVALRGAYRSIRASASRGVP